MECVAFKLRWSALEVNSGYHFHETLMGLTLVDKCLLHSSNEPVQTLYSNVCFCDGCRQVHIWNNKNLNDSDVLM